MKAVHEQLMKVLMQGLNSVNFGILESSLKKYKVEEEESLSKIKSPYLTEEDIYLEYCRSLPFTGVSNERFKRALGFVWQCLPEECRKFTDETQVNIAALILVLFLNRIPSQFWVTLIEGIFINLFDFTEEFNLLLISKTIREREKRIKQLKRIKKNAISLLKELPTLPLNRKIRNFNRRRAEELEQLASILLRVEPYAIKEISEQKFIESISLVSNYIKSELPFFVDIMAEEILWEILERAKFELELFEISAPKNIPKSRKKVPKTELKFFEKFFHNMVHTMRNILRDFYIKDQESCGDWKLWDKLQSSPWKDFVILNPVGMHPNEIHLSKKRLSLLLSDLIRVLSHCPLSREIRIGCNLECGRLNREAEADIIRKMLDQLNPEDTFLWKL